MMNEFNGGEHERWLDMKILSVASCHADIHSVNLRLFANVTQPLNHSIAMVLVTQDVLWTYEFMTAYLCPVQHS